MTDTQPDPTGELPKISAKGAPRVEVLPIERGATPDLNNVNKHTQRGGGLLENSLRKRGAFRSIASAGKGVEVPTVYAGNYTLEKAVTAGFTEIVNVHVTGNQLVNVVRDDIAPGSPEAVALGLEDNEIASKSYNPDIDVLAALAAGDAALLKALRNQDDIFNSLVNGMLPDSAGGEGQGGGEEKRLTLAERFGVPPFSVLDARQGYWQARKRAWLALGIQSELGRGGGGVPPPHPPTVTQNADGTLNYGGTHGQAERFDRQRQPNAAPGGSLRPAMTLENGHTVRGNGKGKKIAAAKVFGSGGPGELSKEYKETLGAIPLNETGADGILSSPGKYAVKDNGLLGKSEQARSHYAPASPYGAYGQDDDVSRRNAAAQPQTGTSIFDPVLCELAYRWFMPPGAGKVIDPFAGGSVRGIVASKLGKQYTGVDLSERQLEANRAQGVLITPDSQPTWINGDAQDIDTLAPGQYDFIFGCPPYADLEVYSDDPADLSRMDYKAFIVAYRLIVSKCVAMLKPDRFACFVVGDIRDKKGFYRNFPAHTIDAFQDAGMILYNEAILVTAVGSLPIRVGRQFDSGRKLGKTHQNVLVFYKGDPKKIREFGSVEFGEAEPSEFGKEYKE